ncbi:bifunctional 3,4-dihydroxy-2-butanone 4-phosphate synthase/GTP cyclohydrolase II [Campylobacter sputorum]|uniref:bifunctional 3,4-dihydroxy-2-butanone 4-phosphate synthase/GTP cyclohydrolase II n=1 Tax=Campylobacter sputorum TaxID=206 RepID=UPI000B772E35|nr:bifunctional 3,4-dihydroxy-2-butanone 4-phosphate synthase/GTP cyclohydrolase II [Campylobacter sputorum]ASM36094.1 bifunctional 3,4-dihydroxy-2-butanone 4-phosphate synthase / GTP cyclohydrolase II protein [Campylobacter sputorum bv. faecalis CCUG 20703]
MALVSVEQAIDDLKQGKMLVMVDDEDRENEGDIIFAATFSDTQKVNFTITHAKGVLCTPISEQIAKKFDLAPMVSSNTSSHETAFTVTIDAKEATTGVSAYERDMTIKLMCSPTATADDFVRPGHIFPLIAKNGGVLVRTGHTEGCVDLCKLAGLMEVAICCEIVKDDGTMARRDDLELFCEKFGLHMVAISDIVKYRLQNETLINIEKSSNVKLAGYEVMQYEIKDHLDRTHFAFVFGNISKRSVVKFEKISSNVDFMTNKKYDDLMKSLEILNEKNGILLFLDDGNDSKNLIKNYGIGAQILKHFGITQIDMISSSSKKEFVGIKGFNLDIVSYIS